MPMPRFLRALSTKASDDGNCKEYIEFDRLEEHESELETNQERLNSIWRNENCSNGEIEEITTHVQKQEFEPVIKKLDTTKLQIHKNTQSHAARTFPKIMHEHVINTKNQFNKVFASTFLSDNIVTFGTKDNKLMLLDVVKGKICQIRLPNPEKSFDYIRKIDKQQTGGTDSSGACGIHDLKYNTNNNMLITGGYHAQDVALFKFDDDVHHMGPRKFSHHLIPLATLKFHKDWVFGMDWLDSEHIVAGGRDGQLSVWNVSNIDSTYQNFRERFRLKSCNNSDLPYTYRPPMLDNNANSDFDDFLGFGESPQPRANNSALARSSPELNESLLGNSEQNQNSLVDSSNGNDSGVDMEHILNLKLSKNMSASHERCNVPILRKPTHFTTNKKHRIRALKAFSKSTSLAHSQCVVTLATNGEIQIYDINRSKAIFSEQLPHRKETVCVEINQDRGQIMVGSQSHIQIFDPRCSMNASLQIIDSLDKNWGCRTVSCNSDLLTIGGGLGRLSFYDLRLNKYINCGTKMKHDKINGGLSDMPIKHRTMEKGWIKDDDVYNNIFVLHGLPTPTAIYTHCYNPNRSRLFVAGGPTPYGLYGSAASVYF